MAKMHVEAIDFGKPCPFTMQVDIYVLKDYEPCAQAEWHADAISDTEWQVHEWYNGHVCGHSGTNSYHDGRNPRIAELLWNYVLSSYVIHVSGFLFTVIFQSARAQAKGKTSNPVILNVRCKRGRHRSLGWACLTTQVLLVYGVRVQIVIDRERLCPCDGCNERFTDAARSD